MSYEIGKCLERNIKILFLLAIKKHVLILQRNFSGVKESIPPASVARRRVGIRQPIPTLFLASIDCSTIPNPNKNFSSGFFHSMLLVDFVPWKFHRLSEKNSSPLALETIFLYIGG
jgi:hypothetical protein